MEAESGFGETRIESVCRDCTERIRTWKADLGWADDDREVWCGRILDGMGVVYFPVKPPQGCEMPGLSGSFPVLLGVGTGARRCPGSGSLT